MLVNPIEETKDIGGIVNQQDYTLDNNVAKQTTDYEPFKLNTPTMKVAGAPDASLLQGSAQNVSPDGLVQNQMTGLLDQNSDYMKRAQSISSQQANGRGLLNSTMAAQAGTAAAIDSAMPIAQQDAQAITQQNMQNQAIQADNDRLQYQTNTDLAKFNTEMQNNSQVEYDKMQLDLNKLTQQQASERIKMEMDANARAWDSYADAYANVAQSDMDKAAKDSMIENLGKSLEEQMSMYNYFRNLRPMPDGTTV